LRSVFLGIELHVAGGLFPVDRAPVHARSELDQRVEVGTVATVALRQQTLHRMALEHLSALPAHRLEVRQDWQFPVLVDPCLTPCQSQWPRPTHPDRAKPRRSAPQRRQRDRPSSPAGSQRNIQRHGVGKRQQRIGRQRHLHRTYRPTRVDLDRDRHDQGDTDRRRLRQRQHGTHTGMAEYRIGEHEGQHGNRPAKARIPGRRKQHRD
jgi:hypothetical protein